MREELKQLKPPEIIEDSTSSLTKTMKQSNHPLSAIAEYHQKNNQTISQGKYRICAQNSLKQKSSKISVAGLISKEKCYAPYWTDVCEEISSRLLSPIEIDCADSDLSLSNTLSTKMVEKSWFSTNLKRVLNQNLPVTFSASSLSSLAECTDFASTVTVSKKIRISPTKHQKTILKSWIDASRFVYNKSIEYINKQDSHKHFFGYYKDILKNLPEFCESIPYQIKKMASKEADIALRSNLKRVKKSSIKKFSLRFKSRKKTTQSCYIPKTAVKESGIYPRISGKSLRYIESLPNDFKDCRLVMENERFYLLVPYERDRVFADNQGRPIAIDRGIRTFCTYFSEKSYGFIGDKCSNRIFRLARRIDKLIEIGKKNSKIRRVIKKIRKKIDNLIDELHWKTISFITQNFDVIILPKFDVSNMVYKAFRKLNKKSVRNLLNLKHYQFSQRLQNKAYELNKIILETSEAYTSKTNSWTGEILDNLGSKSYIKVGDTKINRDLNGARGIFLRAVVDSPELWKLSF